MRRMAEFNDELDTGRFRIQRSVGKLIVLDGRSLREQLTSVPGSVLPVLQNCLLELARDTCSVAAQRLDAPGFDATLLKPLTAMPSVCSDEDCQDVRRKLEEVRAMHDLLKEHRVRVSLDDQTQVDMLEDLVTRRRNSFTSLESHPASSRETPRATQCQS